MKKNKTKSFWWRLTIIFKPRKEVYNLLNTITKVGSQNHEKKPKYYG
jgi:hypothetical protein